MSRWVTFSCPENYIRDEFIKELNDFFQQYNIAHSGSDTFDSIRWLDESPLPDPESAESFLINDTIEKDCNRAVRYHTNDVMPSKKKEYEELSELCIQAFNEYQRLRRLPIQAFTNSEIIECGNCGAQITDDEDYASLFPIHHCPVCKADLRSPAEKEAVQQAEQTIMNAMTERENFFKSHRIATGTRWFVIVKVETDTITDWDIDGRRSFRHDWRVTKQSTYEGND